MSTETRSAAVRVIKRVQREIRARTPPDSPPAADERRTNRDMAATVNSWVEEFRLRRQRETVSLLNLARLRA